MNVPIVVVALVAGSVLERESRDPAPPRPDVPGLVFSAVALTSLLYGIIEAPSKGWTSIGVVAAFVTAAAVGVGFVVHEGRTPEPMLDLRLFRNPRLLWGTVAIALASLALTGLAFDLTQFLQIARGYTPLESGLRFLPIAVGFGVAGPASQRLSLRIGAARTVAGGVGMVAVLFAIVSRVEPATSYWILGPVLFLIGVGVGTAFVSSTDSVMAAVPEANAGLGSAVNDTSRQVGAALGIGIVGSLTNAAYASRIDQTASRFGSTVATGAKQSVGSAMQVADRIGGSAAAALRHRSTESKVRARVSPVRSCRTRQPTSRGRSRARPRARRRR